MEWLEILSLKRGYVLIPKKRLGFFVNLGHKNSVNLNYKIVRVWLTGSGTRGKKKGGEIRIICLVGIEIGKLWFCDNSHTSSFLSNQRYIFIFFVSFGASGPKNVDTDSPIGN